MRIPASRAVPDMEVVGRFAVLAVDTPRAAVGLAADALLPRLRQQARWQALALPKRLLGERYPVLRSRLLGVLAGRSA